MTLRNLYLLQTPVLFPGPNLACPAPAQPERAGLGCTETMTRGKDFKPFSSVHSLGVCAGRERVELLLQLGAGRWEATRPVITKALAAALGPTLSQLSVAGLVSVPSLMAGQLLGGVPPVQVGDPCSWTMQLPRTAP